MHIAETFGHIKKGSMKTRQLLLLAASAFASAVMAQNPRIVLQGSGDPQVFTAIEDALAAAQPNDKLYFSGGSFTTQSGGIEVDIPLHWIGAGISPDSSNVTSITTLATPDGDSDITFTNGAGGSSFTGIRFAPYNGNAFYGKVVRYGTDGTNDAPQDMVFERCIFICGLSLGNEEIGAASSGTFNECIFTGGVYGVGPSATTFTRCVFAQQVTTFRPTGLFIDHCVFLLYGLGDCNNAVVKNSVFYPNDNATGQTNSTWTNCLFGGSALTANVSGTNNIFDQTPNGIFVDQTDSYFQWTDDLHLSAGSPGMDAADDGTNIGIYGSDSPSKLGAMPYNPHYQQAAIATSTNTNGDLPVNIRVAAQPN